MVGALDMLQKSGGEGHPQGRGLCGFFAILCPMAHSPVACFLLLFLEPRLDLGIVLV